jgi:hypothetical protein
MAFDTVLVLSIVMRKYPGKLKDYQVRKMIFVTKHCIARDDSIRNAPTDIGISRKNFRINRLPLKTNEGRRWNKQHRARKEIEDKGQRKEGVQERGAWV